MGDRSKDSALLSFKIAAHRMGYASLLKIFTAAIFCTAVLLAGLCLLLWNLHEDMGLIQARNFRLGQLGSRLHHLDEILTLSVRMAVATGDNDWETRYRNSEALLEEALKESEDMLSDPSGRNTIGRIKTANDKLVALENRAFDLVRRGNGRAAATLLSSRAYTEQKLIYAEELTRVADAVQNLAKTTIDKQQRRMSLSIGGIALVLLFFLVAWIVTYRMMGNYIAERRQAEEERKRSIHTLRNALGGIIEAMARTVETRDPYTAGHQRRVADLAHSIAREMGASPDTVDGIRMAGAIHDIGKISVPAEILSKPAKLSDIEFGLVQIHARAGYDILKEIEFPWPVAQIVLQHHERLNGCGYPQGLPDGEIIPEAKIMAVADVVEAMASYRPYRPAIGIREALEEIAQNRGILYDPAVVDACLRLFKEKEFNFSS